MKRRTYFRLIWGCGFFIASVIWIDYYVGVTGHKIPPIRIQSMMCVHMFATTLRLVAGSNGPPKQSLNYWKLISILLYFFSRLCHIFVNHYTFSIWCIKNVNMIDPYMRKLFWLYAWWHNNLRFLALMRKPLKRMILSLFRLEEA